VSITTESIPVLVLTPPAGRSKAERWLARARSAAAADLVQLLSRIDRVGPIYALCAEQTDGQVLAGLGARLFEGGSEPFHFGEVLAGFARRLNSGQLAYFGGSCAPLASADLIATAFEQVRASDHPLAVVNNLHSSDWIVLNQCGVLDRLTQRLPTDNQLGWVLANEAGHEVISLAPSAATRADIDTPADLLLLKGHPGLGSRLTEILAASPDDGLARVGRLRRILATPGETLAVIGRASSHLWSEIESRTSIWVRLFVEERGMVASGRVERGEVLSLIGLALEEWGPQTFMDNVSRLAGGLVWDTRVWMSHRGEWPSAADRCASDLGWFEEIADPGLRELTKAAVEAAIPVILGGHGVVSGGLYALLEGLEEGGQKKGSHQPIR